MPRTFDREVESRHTAFDRYFSLLAVSRVACHSVEFSLQEALKQQKNYNMCLSKSEELESMIQQWQDLDICGRTLLDEAKSTIKEAPLVVVL